MFNLNQFSRTCCLIILGAFVTLHSALHAQPESAPSADPTAAAAESYRLLAKLPSNQALTVLNGRQSRFLIRSPQPGMEWRLLTFSSQDELEQAKAELDVAGIQHEPDYRLSINSTPNDPRYSEQWGLHNTGQNGGTPDADIDAPEAWGITTGSSEIVVAVIDSGIDYNHLDLKANMWVNAGEIPNNRVDDDGNDYVDDIHGVNFITAPPSGDPLDDSGHGTLLAGIIGAVGNNNQGVVGVNHEVSLMALKTFDRNGVCWASDAIAAIDYAIDKKANVINASWGKDPSSALQDAIRSANDAGILFVAAAGNSSRDNDAVPTYPASYDVPNVLAVAATDRNDKLASFSITTNFLGSNFGTVSVDLGAPGKAILSTVPNDMYQSSEGTSMAAPHVAGAAALLLARNPKLTPQQLKANLMFSGDSNVDLSDITVSGRRLNAHAALTAISAAPRLVINDVTVVEAAGKKLKFTIGLLGVADQTVTVDYATMDDSATADSDYQARNGTLTFAVGEAIKEIEVSVIADQSQEAEEKFSLMLSNASNASILDDTGEGVIIDSSAVPSISIADINVNVSEGNLMPVNVNVSLRGSSKLPFTVHFTTADGTALVNHDYTASLSVPTFFPDKPILLAIIVDALDDIVDENDESFTVKLTGAENAVIDNTRDEATVTIQDNDDPPKVSVLDATVTEGDTANVIVQLDNPSGKEIKLDIEIVNGSAVAGEDFPEINSTELTISPGQTQSTLTIETENDMLDENDEFFEVKLTSAENATLDDAEATVTIQDNDPTPSLVLSDVVSVTEGDTAIIEVKLSNASARQIIVNYATEDGTAVAPGDYIAVSGQLIFEPGETRLTVPVETVDDDLDEGTEEFTFTATIDDPDNSNNVILNDAEVTITVEDNDDDDESPFPIFFIITDDTVTSRPNGPFLSD